MVPLILVDRAVISVGGAEATSFLQSLVSADIEALLPGRAVSAALLTPQGKILFDMIVFRSEDRFLIDCRSEIAEELSKRLSFYRLRSEVQIRPQEAFKVVWLPPAADQNDALFVDPRSAQLGSRALSHNPAGEDGALAYHRQRIAAGIAEAGIDYEPDSVFAHEANLDLLSGISFSKGCFIGQEVVSRMHHRGTARKRFLPCTIDGDIPHKDVLVNAGARKIGTVGSSASGLVLALLRLDHLEDALRSRTPILANGAELTPRIPSWLSAAMPDLLRRSA